VTNEDHFFETVKSGDKGGVAACLPRWFGLKKGTVDVNSRNEYDETPLHIAAMRCHVEIVVMLLKAGADPNLRDHHGQTPLHNTTYDGRPIAAPVASALLKGGADVDVQSKTGNTPLHGAALRGCEDVARVLLAHGADKAVRNKDGFTAEDVAANSRRAGVRLLIMGIGQ
jgi:ankyrin repeat protein